GACWRPSSKRASRRWWRKSPPWTPSNRTFGCTASMPTDGWRLRARDVSVHYWIERTATPFLAVDGVTLDVKHGEFVSIVGPSGCGKTTFLNAIDGLQPISGGALELNGAPIRTPGPDRAVVFQQASL